MKNAEYKFTLDLQKVQSQVTLQVNSGDTARTLLITLTNGGITHKLGENCTAVLSAKKSNGKYLFNSCSIIENNTVIKYDFTSITTDTPGIMQCEIHITDHDENTIISPRFTMIVDALINGDEVFSANENSFMNKAMAQEAMREINEEERKANEEERQRIEALREEAELRRAEELKVAKLRISSLEAAATGSLYETIEESDAKYTTQLPDVLPYGILSQVNASVKRIEIGLPYTLVGAKTYSETPCIVKHDAIIMPKGEKYYVKFPCVLPSGATVTVRADGKNDVGDEIAKFQFITATNSSITEGWVNGSSVTLNAESAYLCINKKSQNTPLTADLEIRNIKVIVTKPDVATLYTKHTIEIPDAMREFLESEGYPYANNYLNLTTRTYHNYYDESGEALGSPTVVDVSEYLESDIDTVPLLPGSLVRFIDESEDAEAVPYTISYKQKIGG